MRRRLLWLLLPIALLLGLALTAWLGLRSDPAGLEPVPPIAAQLLDPVERGAYLARAANCRGCHTARGGEPYAGGRAIPTPFGVFHAPNLTPDADTGLGAWDADAFWLALHEGRGREGAPLYPVFPYTHYTKLSRADADALFAYLRSLPPVRRANRPHELRFPYDQRWLLVAWRALFFRPGGYAMEPRQSETWNRGAYLVQGLGHCGACHESRNSLGAVQSRDNPAGGVVLNWYAPALDAADEAGVAHWPEDRIVALLQTGINEGASTLGPMAEVVYESLQHLDRADLQAMAGYLRSLPNRSPARVDRPQAAEPAPPSPTQQRGARLYAEHCADCHGKQGEGRRPAAPALAGNRALTMASSVNPIRTVLYGGYAPGTAGNPQPFGMPPYYATLSDDEVADILSFARGTWGNRAERVQAFDVTRQRTGPLW